MFLPRAPRSGLGSWRAQGGVVAGIGHRLPLRWAVCPSRWSGPRSVAGSRCLEAGQRGQRGRVRSSAMPAARPARRSSRLSIQARASGRLVGAGAAVLGGCCSLGPGHLGLLAAHCCARIRAVSVFTAPGRGAVAGDGRGGVRQGDWPAWAGGGLGPEAVVVVVQCVAVQSGGGRWWLPRSARLGLGVPGPRSRLPG